MLIDVRVLRAATHGLENFHIARLELDLVLFARVEGDLRELIDVALLNQVCLGSGSFQRFSKIKFWDEISRYRKKSKTYT